MHVAMPGNGGIVKVAAAIVIALCAVGALVGAYLWGLAVGSRRNLDARLRRLGLENASAPLFASAARLILRLTQTTDLDGLFAGDQLSPETKRQATTWVAEYRRKVIKQ